MNSIFTMQQVPAEHLAGIADAAGVNKLHAWLIESCVVNTCLDISISAQGLSKQV